jgi:hypothetical protein
MNNNTEIDMEEDIFTEDESSDRFNELCADLNLDSLTRENTWSTFAGVRQKYTLEVRNLVNLLMHLFKWVIL